MLPYTALAVDYFSYSAVSVIVDADLTLKLLTVCLLLGNVLHTSICRKENEDYDG